MEKKIFSVSEVTLTIKNFLETRFQEIEVQGEVTNFKISSAGHFYFSLKDEKSSLSAVLFKPKAGLAQLQLNNGDRVIVYGSISVYEPSGTYQLIVRGIKKAGIGELLAKVEALKQELQKLGYFDKSRKKRIPSYPKKIVIITSIQGAVIQDFIKVINKRMFTYHLLIYPVKVQGELAASEMEEAIRTINQHQIGDLIVLARGGGSFEDLLPFYDRALLEAIYGSKIPVLSAVGHETDYTLSDFVSDERAPTPSAAAEMVSSHLIEWTLHIKNTYRHIKERYRQKIENKKQSMQARQKALNENRFYQQLSRFQLQMEHQIEVFNKKVEQHIELRKERVKQMRVRLSEKNPVLIPRKQRHDLFKQIESLRRIMDQVLHQKKEVLQRLHFSQLEIILLKKIGHQTELLKSKTAQLQALNPKSIMKKGYCIPFYQNSESIILSSSELKVDSPFDLMFYDGVLQAQVVQKEVYDGKK